MKLGDDASRPMALSAYFRNQHEPRRRNSLMLVPRLVVRVGDADATTGVRWRAGRRERPEALEIEPQFTAQLLCRRRREGGE